MTEFNDWFPTSLHGTPALNPMAFGAYGDGSAHDMNTLFSGDLSAAQEVYPSATSLSDTADWCAFTECFRQAFQHETSPDVWAPNASATWLNKSVAIPSGRYLIRKPLLWQSIQGAHIYGMGGAPAVQIYNETTTAPDNICIQCNGVSFTRVENMTFQSAGGAGSIAFDLNSGTGALVNTNGDTFINCDFASPGGISLAIGDGLGPLPGGGNMSSEMLFIRCFMNNSICGVHINNFNALNYNFLLCGGTDNTEAWLKISSGGYIVVQNASLANNGTQADTNSYDIKVGSGTCVVIGTRSESIRFVQANGPTTILNCAHNFEGNDNVFCYVGTSAHMVGCNSNMGRINGEGYITLENCSFNVSLVKILTITQTPSASTIRVVHMDSAAYPPPHNVEMFLNGDEVAIQGVTSTSGAAAAAVNGVWRITKISHNTIDLIGSTFVSGDAYTNLGSGGGAYIGPGPRYHYIDNTISIGTDVKVKVSGVPSRLLTETKKKDFNLLWLDSGKVFNNDGATSAVVFTLPFGVSYGWSDVQGTNYKFVVLTNQTVTIQVLTGSTSGLSPSNRIIKAGVADCISVSSSTVGSMIELCLVDGAADPSHTKAPYRWAVQSEIGTWTLSGTPA